MTKIRMEIEVIVGLNGEGIVLAKSEIANIALSALTAGKDVPLTNIVIKDSKLLKISAE